MKFKKIGIFDSGIGGLSIVQEVLKIPGLEIVYYADTAHVPYGNRSVQEIQQLSYCAIQKLVAYKVDAIIIACHTVTTNALDFLKEQFPTIFFIDVVDLILQQVAIMHVPKKSIGILGTQATISSGIYEKKLQEKWHEAVIIPQACPQLAFAIEYEFENRKHLIQLLTTYTEQLRKNNVEVIVLACTHYALIQELIASVFDYAITLISAEQSMHNRLIPFVVPSMHKTVISYFSTGSSDQFCLKIKKFTNSDFRIIQH